MKKGKCNDKKIWKKCMFTCQKCTQGTMLHYENKLTKNHKLIFTGEVSKAWKITIVDLKVFQVLEINNLRTNRG